MHSSELVYRFVWVEEDDPALGGQWLAYPPEGLPTPVALADAVLAGAGGEAGEPAPLEVHVAAAQRVIEAAGDLEDSLFPDTEARLRAAVAAAENEQAQVDPTSPEGERVRAAAEALEKLAADMAELVEEQLHSGSLATLPEDCTLALCQAIQAGWRLRGLVDPPGPLYL